MEAWTQYWQQGNEDCLPETNDKDLQRKVAHFWEHNVVNAIAQRQEAPQTILDIACGKGYATKLVAQHLHEPELTIFALDFAEVDFTLADSAAPNLVVLQRTELTDFTGPADVLISNFGIEYLPLDMVLENLEQISVPGATLAFNMHHPESLISKNAHAEQQALEAWLSDKRLAPIEADLGKGFAMPLAQNYLMLLQELNNNSDFFLANTGLPDAIVAALGHAQRHNHGVDFAAIKTTYQGYLARLREQQRAASNAVDLSEALQQKGYQKEFAEELTLPTKGMISFALILTKPN